MHYSCTGLRYHAGGGDLIYVPVLLLNGIGVFGWTFLEVTGGMEMGCWAGRRAGGIFDVVPHFI